MRRRQVIEFKGSQFLGGGWIGRVLSGVENLTDAARNRLKGLSDRWTWAARVFQIGLFVLALGYTVCVTQSVVVPIILSWVVATIFLPIIDRP
jgi:hypothetical protein